MELLVSYPWGQFGHARREALALLVQLGDSEPGVVHSAVPGIAIAHTVLDPRAVVRECHTLHQAGRPFEYAPKWVPVDIWCDSNIDAMREAIIADMLPRIEAHQSWGMRVDKHGWPPYHTDEIVRHLASTIDRKVDLTQPDWWLRIDILGDRTAMALLKPDEMFSVAHG
jgi:tRNA(Ser,Leu) C12 N-acetylase TAN1